MTEVWKPVVGREGDYEVSDEGRVRSVPRRARHNVAASGTQSIAGRMLTPQTKQGGYLCVGLRAGKTNRQWRMVHRLVAEAFIPNPANFPCVNHINNNPASNAVANLEWCTQAENLAHMTAQGRRSTHWAGKRTPVTALSDDQASALRERYAAGDISLEAVGRLFGVSKRTAHRCVKGLTYQPLPAAPSTLSEGEGA